MADINLQEVYDFAKQLARQAGREIKAASDKRWHASEGSSSDSSKINSVDASSKLVAKALAFTSQNMRSSSQRQIKRCDSRPSTTSFYTAYYAQVEALVKRSIAQTFPTHKFIGEESYAAGEVGSIITVEPTWVVDPIDGTTNFVHGFPHVCISIGFCLDKKPTIGVIYNPFLDTLYEGMSGHGSYCNGVRLPYSQPHPLPLHDLGSALIGAEYGSIRDGKTMRSKTESFGRLAGDPATVSMGAMCHSIRSIGSAALHYAFVAAGQQDMYWEIGCYSWDVCAGIVIAQEAGGRCYGKHGKLMDEQGAALMGRHFFVIRGLPGSAEERIAAQDRLAKDFFERVTEWDV